MNTNKDNWLTIPNIFSLLRIFLVPILIFIAYQDYPNLFLILAAFALSTDAIDGFLARKLNQITTLGTTLDSVGDMMMYFTLPICGWLLWPDMIMKDINYIIFVMIAFIVPMLAGFIKFGRLPSYHTLLAKASTIFISIATLLWFITEHSLFFKIAVIIQICVMIEYIAITIRLQEWRGNITSYWHIDQE